MKLNNLDYQKGLNLPPKINEELVEFVGIHYGDGYLKRENNKTYKMTYCLNLRDISYSIYVQELFYKLFHTQFKVIINKQKHAITLYYHSKALCEYLNQILKIPYSPKTNLEVPEYIKENNEYIKRFIRGLFDTDGCAIIQKVGKYRYHLIKITTKSSLFAHEIKKLLLQIQIISYICTKKGAYDIMVRNIDSVAKFYTEIDPKNKKNGDAEI